jgi:hypothetical protein
VLARFPNVQKLEIRGYFQSSGQDIGGNDRFEDLAVRRQLRQFLLSLREFRISLKPKLIVINKISSPGNGMFSYCGSYATSRFPLLSIRFYCCFSVH